MELSTQLSFIYIVKAIHLYLRSFSKTFIAHLATVSFSDILQCSDGLVTVGAQETVRMKVIPVEIDFLLVR